MEEKQEFSAISYSEQALPLLQITGRLVEDDQEPNLLRNWELWLKKRTRHYFGVNSLKKRES